LDGDCTVGLGTEVKEQEDSARCTITISLQLGNQIMEDEIGFTCSTRREVDAKYSINVFQLFVMGEWRKLHNEEFHDLYSSQV
jgi:hypothetical protein